MDDTQEVFREGQNSMKKCHLQIRKSIRVNGQLFTLQREGVGPCRRVEK